MYPEVGPQVKNSFDGQDFANINRPAGFRRLKGHLHAASQLLHDNPNLSDEQKEKIVQVVLEEGKHANVVYTSTGSTNAQKSGGSWGQIWTSFCEGLGKAVGVRPSESEEELRRSIKDGEACLDPLFLSRLPQLVDAQPVLAGPAEKLLSQWRSIVKNRADQVVKPLCHKIRSLQERILRQRNKDQIDGKLKNTLDMLRNDFLHGLDALHTSNPSSDVLTYNTVAKVQGNDHAWSNSYATHWNTGATGQWLSSGATYRVSGDRVSETRPSFHYTIHVFSLTEEDKHDLRLHQSHIPHPSVSPRFAHSFSMPVSWHIRYAQLLANDKCFLVVDTGDALQIFIEPLSQLDAALGNGRSKTKIVYERIGQDFVLNFDEARRAMVIFAAVKGEYLLHLFECDESFNSIRATSGSPFNLTSWFETAKTIVHVCFVGGSDSAEVCLVDESHHARIFSMVTAQFRPATLTFDNRPLLVGNTPDGACLASICVDSEGQLVLEAYHWASFGSTPGHHIYLAELEDAAVSSFTFTSFLDRSHIHLLALCLADSCCRSYAIEISKKVTEYALTAKGATRLAVESGSSSSNALLECLSDVWTRFPVVPAVARTTITSGRASPSITFVTDRDHRRYPGHFAESIRTFEQTTRKPTSGRLAAIQIRTTTQDDVLGSTSKSGALSILHAGEWLIEAMCLIPIQIAVTRENRFIPLKDGVWSSDLERSLLGATVNQVAGSLSLGWYESIFSYPPFVNRPVKVVSSMGEQSVGKSFSMNHLVDTSFAGSAMRCTEGVWMSCTPTNDALIVALDFEGVQSIERSAQEDTLLVLFNTAVSNMILFRNNFALSRDIAGLFTSFQTASAILDPAANPTLFQSRLVIIIKDVIENDKLDMVKEFQLKFARIVAEEQQQNFFTKSHRGQVSIIPWPVIESRQFYEMFGDLRKRLAKQRITHPSTGGFLKTLKTLMAKIKTHDWGALDQNLASQRMEDLVKRLFPALVYGLGSPPPDGEPLKNYDDESIIAHRDTTDVLYLAGPTFGVAEDSKERRLVLDTLRQSCKLQSERQVKPDSDWVDAVAAHIQTIAGRRVEHVGDWVAINTARFATSPETQKLRRILDAAIIDLMAGLDDTTGSMTAEPLISANIDASISAGTMSRNRADYQRGTLEPISVIFLYISVVNRAQQTEDQGA
ncbi:hypothetical protein AURDEDRAFT_162532 [Auricularia subglabra TFB-10046 SS5]|nr:hypothetical protein AURDEDRAFT_162532 [Auricularia subglabra TFB-10046 SS5]